MAKLFERVANENWNDDDDKSKIKHDRNFVACSERKTSEKDKFDEYEAKYSKTKVDECCEKVKAPRSRVEFEKCLEERY